jgi:hypothetical protein
MEDQEKNKKLTEKDVFPDDLDDFMENRSLNPVEKRDLKPVKPKYANKTMRAQDPLAIKRRAYELIIKGMSSYSYMPILCREFKCSDKVIHHYLKDLKVEIREQYEEIYSVLREAIVMDLFKMKNDALTIHEKLKCYELIIKITGLSQENINIKQTTENKTFVITQIEPKNKEE